MSRACRWCCIALFLGLLLTPLVVQTVGALGGIEPLLPNRQTLAAEPVLFEDGFNAAFFQEFDAWYRDHFGLRGRMMQANSWLNLKLLNSSAVDRVIAGKNGWLYLNDTLPVLQDSRPLGAEDIARILRLLRLQQRLAESRGARFVFLIAPNKGSIYPEYLPARYQAPPAGSNRERLQAAMRDAGIRFVDAYALLKEQKPAFGDRLYHTTDMHWRAEGARIVAEAVGAAAGLAIPALTGEQEIPWQGDLADMLLLKLPDADTQYALPPYESDADWGTSAQIARIQTQGQTDAPRLLCQRDSFITAMVPFLAPCTSEAVFLWSTQQLDYRGIDADRPDVILVEMVEQSLHERMLLTPLAPAFALEAEPEGETAPGTLELATARWRDGTLTVRGSATWETAQAVDPSEAYPVVRLETAEGETLYFMAWPLYREEDIDENGMPVFVPIDAGFQLLLPDFAEGKYTLSVGWQGEEGTVVWVEDTAEIAP